MTTCITDTNTHPVLTRVVLTVTSTRTRRWCTSTSTGLTFTIVTGTVDSRITHRAQSATHRSERRGAVPRAGSTLSTSCRLGSELLGALLTELDEGISEGGHELLRVGVDLAGNSVTFAGCRV